MRENDHGFQSHSLDNCVDGNLSAKMQRKYWGNWQLLEEDGDVHSGHETSRWKCPVGSRVCSLEFWREVEVYILDS